MAYVRIMDSLVFLFFLNILQLKTNIFIPLGDDNAILIWNVSHDNVIPESTCSTDSAEQESKLECATWSVHKTLRGHLEDIYDLAWSNDSTMLLSGSVDNSAILWDIEKAQPIRVFKDHKHYVQGVAFDPSGEYIATLSSDRSLKIHNINKPRNVKNAVYTVQRLVTPNTENTFFRTFKDETLSTFFRRLSFSPDGNILIAPTAQYMVNEKLINVSLVFTRYSLDKPVLYHLANDKPSILVRFNPFLYKLVPTTDTPLFDLPYRMIYAIATLDTVVLYDTQRIGALAIVGQIHYANLTDLTWSNDGRILAISSTDSYCTLVLFEEGELGEIYTNCAESVTMDTSVDNAKELNTIIDVKMID